MADEVTARHVTASGVDEHALPVDADNPDGCTPEHYCNEHAADHAHGDNCGHAMVPHGDHVGYLVDGHLHRARRDHCGYHGRVTPSSRRLGEEARRAALLLGVSRIVDDGNPLVWVERCASIGNG